MRSNKMDELARFLPGKLVVLCTVLSFFIPFFIYRVTQKLHELGDPPWKKDKHE